MTLDQTSAGPDQGLAASPSEVGTAGKEAFAAKKYLGRKWRPIPLPHKSKASKSSGWPTCVVDEKDLALQFSTPCNVGILLGGSDLTDVDVDSAMVAPFLDWLPATEARWGRPGNPNSHYLYQDERQGRSFKNSQGVIIEIRSKGCYAVVPPSVHPDNEEYVWEVEGEPGKGDDLEACVKRIAIAATLLPAWKEGKRHDLALATAGVLLKGGWEKGFAAKLVLAVAKAAGDPELADRVMAVNTTFDHLSTGAPVAGISKLSEILGPQDASAIAGWVGGGTSDIGVLASRAKTVIDKRNVALELRKDLETRGTFHRTKGTGELFYFHKAERVLYEFGSVKFRALCSHLYGINGKEPSWGYIEEELRTHSTRDGVPIEFFKFARYQNGMLYVHTGEQRVLRLNGAKIDAIVNGDDGVLFRDDPTLAPIVPNYQYVGSPVRDYLVNVANATNKSSLDLYECHIYAMFFEELLPTKPIVLFTGPKGSGKTSAGRALKRALHGPKANVDTAVGSKEDAFRAAICHDSLLCVDNVDTLVPWLADALAVVATGGTVKLRKLYETNTLIEYVPRTFVMVTSRNPQSFTRDDVADRLLLIDVERRKDFMEESHMQEMLDAHRPRIWGELLTNLNKMVAELKKPMMKSPLPHRLADWARLAIRFAPLLGISDVEMKLKAMDASKVAFALDDHPVAQGIEEWVTANPQHGFIASGDLFQAIKQMYESKDQQWPVKDARAFGMQLKNLRADLESRYKIEDKPGPSNKKLFRFARLAQSATQQAGTQQVGCFSV